MIAFALLGHHASALVDGDGVFCDENDPTVYRINGSVLNGYPTGKVADSCDPEWRIDTPLIDCSSYTFGPAKSYCVNFGASVKCDPLSPTVYLVTEDPVTNLAVLRGFRTQADADSCDPDWRNFEVIDCTAFIIGPPMDTCGPIPGLATDTAVKCDPAEFIVYNYELTGSGAVLRGYRTQADADSCDPDWREAELVDCSNIPVGPAMDNCGVRKLRGLN